MIVISVQLNVTKPLAQFFFRNTLLVLHNSAYTISLESFIYENNHTAKSVLKSELAPFQNSSVLCRLV